MCVCLYVCVSGLECFYCAFFERESLGISENPVLLNCFPKTLWVTGRALIALSVVTVALVGDYVTDYRSLVSLADMQWLACANLLKKALRVIKELTWFWTADLQTADSTLRHLHSFCMYWLLQTVVNKVIHTTERLFFLSVLGQQWNQSHDLGVVGTTQFFTGQRGKKDYTVFRTFSFYKKE